MAKKIKRVAKKAVKKTAKRKPRKIAAKSLRAKRNPAPPAKMAREKASEFVVVVESGSFLGNRKFYWTGKLLDSEKPKAKRFKYHDEAARAARGVAVKVPKTVSGIWVERA